MNFKDDMECGGLPPLSKAELAPRSVVTEASLGKQSAGKPAQSINYGTQPLDKIMEERGLKNHDLVAVSKDGLTHKQVQKGRKGRRLTRLAVSKDGLTHKQVQKGRKGRRLTRHIQDKIVNALSISAGTAYKIDQLFNYR